MSKVNEGAKWMKKIGFQWQKRRKNAKNELDWRAIRMNWIFFLATNRVMDFHARKCQDAMTSPSYFVEIFVYLHWSKVAWRIWNIWESRLSSGYLHFLELSLDFYFRVEKFFKSRWECLIKIYINFWTSKFAENFFNLKVIAYFTWFARLLLRVATLKPFDKT